MKIAAKRRIADPIPITELPFSKKIQLFFNPSLRVLCVLRGFKKQAVFGLAVN
jgi:hypothetical protein